MLLGFAGTREETGRGGREGKGGRERAGSAWFEEEERRGEEG